MNLDQIVMAPFIPVSAPPDGDEVRVESKVGRLYPIAYPTRIRVRYDPA